MASPLQLALVIHAHQPVGNFEHVLEAVHRLSYAPFVDVLNQHPAIRVALHYSGILLEWLEQRHPEYVDLLGDLVERGQVEMVGGGFYEPVLASLPLPDRLAQLERMSRYLEKRFGRRPRGAWLTERVWDPSIPETLAQAGIEYTLTDDYHFLCVGLEKDQLLGYYLTEWQGHSVKVLPGLKDLRYLLPFRMEQEAIDYLRALAERGPGGVAIMGDDLEKFGGWPQTYDHVYTNGWLERFFQALERSSDWLVTSLPGDYIHRHPPLGRIYLPTASYQEMMGWALPAAASVAYEEFLHRVEQQPEGGSLARFIHGGLWHNFFHKYEEANHLHKRMLEVSRRYQDLALGLAPTREARERYEQGYENLLRSQCNDAYWHGVFGGLYAPHLRTGVYQALLEAEKTADELETAPPAVKRLDFNLDGREEVFLSTGELVAVVTPGDGGTVAEISYRPRAFNAVNSLRRRPEGYHAKLRQAGHGSTAAASIHDRVTVKEEGLERFLQYDRYNRHACRSLIFGAGRTLEDYRTGRLEESRALASGAFDIVAATPGWCALEGRDLDCVCQVRSVLTLLGSRLEADWQLHSGTLADLKGGLELVLNLLAPDAPDRYFELPGNRRERLAWSGEVAGPQVALVDEWLDLRIHVTAEPAATWWIVPIFTVSQSEGGFERVYQGSCLLPHWPVPNGNLHARLRVEFSPAR
jgi:hypothetical protein